MAIGTVKWFNTTKGFGFIMPQDAGKDVVVHITAVQAAGRRGLNDRQKVSYEVAMERRKAAATNLKLLCPTARRKGAASAPAEAALSFCGRHGNPASHVHAPGTRSGRGSRPRRLSAHAR